MGGGGECRVSGVGPVLSGFRGHYVVASAFGSTGAGNVGLGVLNQQACVACKSYFLCFEPGRGTSSCQSRPMPGKDVAARVLLAS